jgi:hypothetical protein
MKFRVALLALTCLLSGCQNLSAPSQVASQASDYASLGGLSDALGAHPSVELQAPLAFALTPNAFPFLQALARVVEPLRLQLAQSLMSDRSVSQGLAGWELANGTTQLSVLKRIAAIEGSVMNCQVPPLIEQAGPADQTGVMAYYQPGTSDIGQVVLYPDAIAQGGKYLALSTLVHEMRHAAQYQLVQSKQAGQLSAGSDNATLATAYAAAWSAMDSLGGESKLAYGDYAHLNVEYDAFQTGNEVATIVSQGAFSALGYGFVDAAYSQASKPQLNLLTLTGQYAGSQLVAAVNQAEYRVETSQGSGQPSIKRPRHRGIVVKKRS